MYSYTQDGELFIDEELSDKIIGDIKMNQVTGNMILSLSRFSGEPTENLLQRLVMMEYQRHYETPSAIYHIEDF